MSVSVDAVPRDCDTPGQSGKLACKHPRLREPNYLTFGLSPAPVSRPRPSPSRVTLHPRSSFPFCQKVPPSLPCLRYLTIPTLPYLTLSYIIRACAYLGYLGYNLLVLIAILRNTNKPHLVLTNINRGTRLSPFLSPSSSPFSPLPPSPLSIFTYVPISSLQHPARSRHHHLEATNSRANHKGAQPTSETHQHSTEPNR